MGETRCIPSPPLPPPSQGCMRGGEVIQAHGSRSPPPPPPPNQHLSKPEIYIGCVYVRCCVPCLEEVVPKGLCCPWEPTPTYGYIPAYGTQNDSLVARCTEHWQFWRVWPLLPLIFPKVFKKKIEINRTYSRKYFFCWFCNHGLLFL